MAKVKSVIGSVFNSKAGRGAASAVETMKDAKRATFSTVNKHPTSMVNKWTSSVNKNLQTGNKDIVKGVIERQTPGATNLYTGVGLTKGADMALGAITLGAFAGAGVFKSSEAYQSVEKFHAARSNEVNSESPYNDMGMYDYGVTDAMGIGFQPQLSNARSYRSSRDYSLGATGDLTLGLHKSRRRG